MQLFCLEAVFAECSVLAVGDSDCSVTVLKLCAGADICSEGGAAAARVPEVLKGDSSCSPVKQCSCIQLCAAL